MGAGGYSPGYRLATSKTKRTRGTEPAKTREAQLFVEIEVSDRTSMVTTIDVAGGKMQAAADIVHNAAPQLHLHEEARDAHWSRGDGLRCWMARALLSSGHEVFAANARELREV